MMSDAWIDFLAGWCSGGAAVLAIQPVDTVLTRLQAGTAVPVRNLVSTVGVSSLWRGSSAMIGAVPIQNALLMGGYGLGKRWSSDPPDDAITSSSNNNNNAEALTAIFVGGCVGGILQSFLMSPVELIKVHQQVHTEQSALAAGKYVVNTVVAGSSGSAVAGTGSDASLSLWRGLGATLLRDGIPHGVWFVSYEMCKNYLESLSSSNIINSNNGVSNDIVEKKESTNWSIPLASGAVAATVAWVRIVSPKKVIISWLCSRHSLNSCFSATFFEIF